MLPLHEHEMMPGRNRVTPTGDIEAIPLRGVWTGNQGILHSGTKIVRFHASDLWITCALQFRGHWREQWRPHHYMSLYFYDEAVSFAAGHRPCAECRGAGYNAYRNAWVAGLGVEPGPLGQMVADDDSGRTADHHEGPVGQLAPRQVVTTPAVGATDDALTVQSMVHLLR